MPSSAISTLTRALLPRRASTRASLPRRASSIHVERRRERAIARLSGERRPFRPHSADIQRRGARGLHDPLHRGRRRELKLRDPAARQARRLQELLRRAVYESTSMRRNEGSAPLTRVEALTSKEKRTSAIARRRGAPARAAASPSLATELVPQALISSVARPPSRRTRTSRRSCPAPPSTRTSRPSGPAALCASMRRLVGFGLGRVRWCRPG